LSLYEFEYIKYSTAPSSTPRAGARALPRCGA
jgi:hypothetical protein